MIEGVVLRLNLRAAVKRNINPQRVAGFVALGLPILTAILSHIWAGFAVEAIFGEGPNPVWWPAEGTKMGLIPSILCGLYGIIVGIWGYRAYAGSLVAGGLWCFLAAPIIAILYVLDTF